MEVRDFHVVAVDSYKKTTRAMFQNPFIRSFGQFPGRRQASQRTNLQIYIHQPSQYVSEKLRPDKVSKFYGKNQINFCNGIMNSKKSKVLEFEDLKTDKM